MKLKVWLVGLVGLFCFVGTFVDSVIAQPRPDTSGAIEFENEDKSKDPYKDSQDKAIEYYNKYLKLTADLAQGKAEPMSAIDSRAINYLTGAYLFCISKQGVCSAIVQSILDVDVINSRLEKKASCPNMIHFWDSWIKNGFEERHKFMVQLGHSREVGDFNANVRPGLIRCQKTVEEAIAGSGTDSEYFKTRFAKDSPRVKNIQFTTEFISRLKENIPNVFKTIGASN